MTTKDVIKILPMESKLKIQMLNIFDFLEPEQRLTVERFVWNTYHTLYQERLEENLALQEDDVITGDGTYKDFYVRAVKKTEEEMQKEMSEDETQFDLAAARQAVEQIMQEISASKKPSHHVTPKKHSN